MRLSHESVAYAAGTPNKALYLNGISASILRVIGRHMAVVVPSLGVCDRCYLDCERGSVYGGTVGGRYGHIHEWSDGRYNSACAVGTHWVPMCDWGLSVA